MNAFQVKMMKAADGETVEAVFETLWSPEKVSLESIAEACAAQISGITKVKHLPLSAVLVEA